MAGTEAEELEGIKNVLNGTVTGPLTQAVTQLAAIVTRLDNAIAQLSAINTTSSTIKTAIDNVDVDVSITQSDVSQAISAQTTTRQPLIDSETTRREVTAATNRTRNPNIPRPR